MNIFMQIIPYNAKSPQTTDNTPFLTICILPVWSKNFVAQICEVDYAMRVTAVAIRELMVVEVANYMTIVIGALLQSF